jgi:hypothetical protein
MRILTLVFFANRPQNFAVMNLFKWTPIRPKFNNKNKNTTSPICLTTFHEFCPD